MYKIPEAILQDMRDSWSCWTHVQCYNATVILASLAIRVMNHKEAVGIFGLTQENDEYAAQCMETFIDIIFKHNDSLPDANQGDVAKESFMELFGIIVESVQAAADILKTKNREIILDHMERFVLKPLLDEELQNGDQRSLH